MSGISAILYKIYHMIDQKKFVPEKFKRDTKIFYFKNFE